MPSTRVLVADDVPHQASYLQHMLRKGGYDARAMGRAEQLQTALDDFRPSALLLNVEIDAHKGMAICRALLQEPLATVPAPVEVSAARPLFEATCGPTTPSAGRPSSTHSGIGVPLRSKWMTIPL